MISKLNCSVGDLAITVNCRLPQNLGNIVRIVSSGGLDEWQGFSELLYTWNVEVATEGGQLFYEGDAGLIELPRLRDTWWMSLLIASNYS